MAFELRHTEDNRVLHSSEISVDDFFHDKLVENKHSVDLSFASAQMSQWVFDGIRMIHNNWQYKTKGDVAWKSDLDIIHLQFNLKGKFSMVPKQGHLSVSFNENQHNMLYTNGASGIIKNEALTSSQFLLQFSKEAFLRLAENSNESLQRFAGKVVEGKAASLADHNLPIDLSLMQAINAVINCNYRDGIKKMFLFSKAIEILVLQAELFNKATQRNNTVIKTPYDRECILYAKEYLSQNIEDPPTLSALARITGLNEYKLKHGFKELFNITAFGFVAEKRLELAKVYLQDQQRTIGEIADLLGYSSIQHFSVAFKKKFGVSPNKVR
jgi:AraC family transcriptional activator of pyochelin receptor